MPRVEEDPPDRVILQRGELEVSIGDETADFTWDEIEDWRIQRDRWNRDRGTDVGQVRECMAIAVVMVKRKFPGARVEGWYK